MNTIRRSDAIDALIKEYPYINPTSITDVIMQVKDAQSQRKWIPCSERLPEQNGQYLTFHKFHGLNIYNVYRFGTDLYEIDDFDFYDFKGVSGWYDYDSEYGYFLEDVDAWMPLPEPYREVEHD